MPGLSCREWNSFFRGRVVGGWGIKKNPFLFSHCTKSRTRERCLRKRMKSPFVFSTQIFWSVLTLRRTSAWLVCSWRAVLVPSLGRVSLFLELLTSILVSLCHPFLWEQSRWHWAGGGGAGAGHWTPEQLWGLNPGSGEKVCAAQCKATGLWAQAGTLAISWSEQWPLQHQKPWHNSSLPSPFHHTCLWDLCWVADTYPPVTPPSSLPNGGWNSFWWVVFSGNSKPLKILTS